MENRQLLGARFGRQAEGPLALGRDTPRRPLVAPAVNHLSPTARKDYQVVASPSVTPGVRWASLIRFPGD